MTASTPDTKSRLATIVFAALLIVAACLLWYRGGLLAWTGTGLAVAGMAKTLIRPSAMDVKLVVAAVVLWALAWVGVAYYVFSTWEQGEVVTLDIDTERGVHSVRTWIVDDADGSVVIYDAHPDVVAALERGNRVVLTRDTTVVEYTPVLIPDDAPALQGIYALFDEKYGELNVATERFYAWMGRRRGRIVASVRLVPGA